MKISTVNQTSSFSGRTGLTLVLWNKIRTSGFMLTLLSCFFILPALLWAQDMDLKKGYSKQDYLKANQRTNDAKDHAASEAFSEKLSLIQGEINEKCGFTYIENFLQQKFPERPSTQQFELWMEEKIAKGEYNALTSLTVITIPVVVHVIHNGEAVGTGSNISDAQVMSQIDVLNEDFRRLNVDAGNTPADFLPVAADAMIEFCLATVDPEGNPTNGINRYNGGQASYSISNLESNIKPNTIWHPYFYFNIWCAPLQGGLLGYAQFPDNSGLQGMPPDIPQNGIEATDGIVVRDFAFGTTGSATAPFDLGRTATHEAGHFFGLRHNGGDGNCSVDDFVTDTPTQSGQNNNFVSDCSYPADNDCIDSPVDFPDMFMNYMDYSDDGCMNLFTIGQKTRFDVVLTNSPRRLELVNSQVCNGVPPDYPFDPFENVPDNDLCENAEPISCNETLSGTTLNALFDNVGTCGTSNTAPGVWYSFVATGTNANLSTCNQASFDTKISVFTGSCGSLTCVGGQDDAAGCAGFTTSLDVVTIPGETYYVLVHGFGSATGNFSLTLSCPEPPVNDLCENAIPLQCEDVVSGNTEYATATGAPATDCFEDPWSDDMGPGVWYTLYGTGDDITLSTCDNANFDTKIDVFTGSCGDLTCYAGNDDGPGCPGFTSELTFSSVEGDMYYIYVSGYTINGILSATGDFTLTVDCHCIVDAGPCATVYYGYEPAECTDLTASADFGVPPYSYDWSTGESTQSITVCPMTETTYTVTVTDAEGCTNTDEVTVEVVDVRCGNKLNKVELCHFPPDNPENPHVICVSPNAVPDHLLHGDHLGSCGIEPCDGLYPGTPDNGSGQFKSMLVIDQEDWSIYPNPAMDNVTIDLVKFIGQEIQIRIYDAKGNVLWNRPTQILESASLRADLSKAASGVYHVSLQTKDQSVVKKLVITK